MHPSIGNQNCLEMVQIPRSNPHTSLPLQALFIDMCVCVEQLLFVYC